ncbi:MAG: hypothetical protein ICV82_03045 [Nitrososphaera sp.]|nr:hypothetical protein [Nitrososphaera sp.]
MGNDFVIFFYNPPIDLMVVLKYCDWITEALHSIPITGTSSLLWLHPTLLVASPDCAGIELQYEL